MSINRNRAKLNKAMNNEEYNRIMKNDGVYCIICVRRSGSYNGSCHPSTMNPKGWKYRKFRTWKHNRKKTMEILINIFENFIINI